MTSRCYYFVFRALMMIVDSLYDSLKGDWKLTMYLYTPVMACLSLFYAITTLPCYIEQRGIIFLMINYVLSVITLNIMLYNMAGKPFSVLQPIILLLTVPLVAHLAGVDAQT